MNLLFWLNLFFAQEETDSSQLWMQLYEGQLSQIIEYEPSDSIEIYNALLDSISVDNPIYSDIYYQLALAQFATGEVAKAKQSLQVAKKNNKLANRSGAFYEQLVMWEKAPSQVPYKGNSWLQDSSYLWKTALSNVSPRTFGFAFELPVDATITIRIVDWKNKIWQRSLSFVAGRHTFTDQVDTFVRTGDKILSISVFATDQQARTISFQMGELVLQ